MFDLNDVKFLSYFELVYIQENEIEIKSVCTGHFWKIIIKGKNSILYHKYKKSESYHFQFGCCSVCESLLEIVCHDEYVLKKKKMLTQAKECSVFFDYLLKTV